MSSRPQIIHIPDDSELAPLDDTPPVDVVAVIADAREERSRGMG